MKILFDQGTPVPLKNYLQSHSVETAFELGWSTLENGELLNAAESLFDLFITTDQHIRHQQNLEGRKLAILVLATASWPRLRELIPEILEAVNSIQAGEFREISVR
jgi:hypothetical protein